MKRVNKPLAMGRVQPRPPILEASAGGNPSSATSQVKVNDNTVVLAAPIKGCQNLERKESDGVLTSFQEEWRVHEILY